ncbi:hypothetical protein SS50377_24662 [Spironucleus salmonicida]|uniref:Myb-like domain-containing protein n=1 Tax=Spironucleus salmonicida TaxID=348837 RepID=V6LJC5_9EUKA|nr:hypothetical protein SS50377_24662 [Spironucleus salmonicida]|eukprot:EST44473.1 Hypothetical protein SS50377_15467 [Spironucleus salmonicida]
MPIQSSWTRKEEKMLCKFIADNNITTSPVDWTGVQRYLPNRSTKQITAKFFRMKNDISQRWDFDAKNLKFCRSEPQSDDSDNVDKMIIDLCSLINNMQIE